MKNPKTAEPSVDALLCFHEFGVPRTPKTKDKSIKYEKIIGGDLSAEVVEMLKTGTQQRRLLVQGLTYAGTTPNPQNVIGAVNAYLPSVWRIQKSLEYSSTALIKVQQPLLFTWDSVLTNSETDKTLTQSVFIYEVAMILVVRALSHYNLAENEVLRALGNQDNMESLSAGFKNAVSELRTGAGVLKFTAEKILPHWKKPPSNPLPEINRKVLEGLSLVFLATAQRIIIAKAILAKSYSVIPQLLLGMKDKYDQASRWMQGAFVLSAITEECNLMVLLGETLANKYTAVGLNVKIEAGAMDDVDDVTTWAGNTVAFMMKANEGLRVNWGRFPSIRKRFEGHLKNELAIVRLLKGEYEDTNNSVYFGEVVLDEADLPPRSQHRFMPTPIEFQPPPVKPLSFMPVIQAPPGIEQKDFDQMPSDIQQELIQEHKAKVEAEKQAALDAQKAAKKGGGLFGKKKKKEKKEKKGGEQQMQLPPGVDPATFKELPLDMQQQILKEHAGK